MSNFTHLADSLGHEVCKISNARFDSSTYTFVPAKGNSA